MNISKLAQASLVSMAADTADTFARALQHAYQGLQGENLIIDLNTMKEINPETILCFGTLSARHRATGKSFVLVTSKVSYAELPEELIVVPSVQEACDLIEMEEIERDLDSL